MRNPYLPSRAILREVIPETPTIRTFVIEPEKPFAFATGQFVQLTVPGVGEAPFTPSSSPASTRTIDLTVMRVGTVTERLHALEPGAILGIRGPYGRGYPVDEFRGKPIVILGGGVGLAPLRSLLLTLLDDPASFSRITLLYGARTPEDIVYKRLLPAWRERVELRMSVDKGSPDWKETIGVVTVLLDQVDLDVGSAAAVVCGPPIMMKFGTMKLLEKGFPPERIFLSMESNMSCGIGQCRHCAVGPLYACKDGPVFAYAELAGLSKIWV
ncbi:MAG: FAD/NAD(P)-binding protein [Planctomycetes bacterium]|nr:FAD/NAD(P)-binding protein [Planctomycetota bacterium]